MTWNCVRRSRTSSNGGTGSCPGMVAGVVSAVMVISHDRAFLTRLSRRTLWLDRGTLREHDEGYGAFVAWSEAILLAESAAEARLDKQIARETLWSREGISARRK